MDPSRNILIPKPPSKLLSSKTPSEGTWRGPRDPFAAFRPKTGQPAQGAGQPVQTTKQPAGQAAPLAIASTTLPYAGFPVEIWSRIIEFLQAPDQPVTWMVAEGDVQGLRFNEPENLPDFEVHMSAQTTIATLCRVSKQMASIVRRYRYLYRKVFIASPEALELLLRTLSSNGQLRAHIEQLFCFIEEGKPSEVNVEEKLRNLVCLLPALTDLHCPWRILRNLMARQGWNKVDIASPIQQNSFDPRRLKRLRFRLEGRYDFSLNWLKFLPELETLVACSPFYHTTKKSDMHRKFPKLKHLDLYHTTLSERQVARICLACPNLERLAVQFCDMVEPFADSLDLQLDDALLERARTLRHLELRSPQHAQHYLDGSDNSSDDRVWSIPDLTNLEELVIDLPGLFGRAPGLLGGVKLNDKDIEVFEELPPSLRRLKIACQWPLRWMELASSLLDDEEDGDDDDNDVNVAAVWLWGQRDRTKRGRRKKDVDYIDSAAALKLLKWLSSVHRKGCLPPPKDGRPFQVTLSLPGPWRGTNRAWRERYNLIVGTAGWYFRGSDAGVEIRVKRLEPCFDNGYNEGHWARNFKASDNKDAWPEETYILSGSTRQRQHVGSGL